MIDYTKQFAQTEAKKTDQGLRAYMLKIYNYMALGLLLTAITGYITISVPAFTSIVHGTPLGILFQLLPFGIVIYFSMGIGKMSVDKARTLFWVYAGAMGVALSYIALAYTGVSLIRTFLVCTSMFGAMSIYGYTTEKDLTSMGSFMFMGLIGIIIASLLNIFLKSSALDFAVSIIGVIVFLGLTAWDTQKLKSMYYMAGNGEAGQKLAISGALTLYLDFINIFLFMLRFLGDRRQ